ncbi:MAG: hypothetical protein WCF24_07205 [Acidimicrobiales bacterium]
MSRGRRARRRTDRRPRAAATTAVASPLDVSEDSSNAGLGRHVTGGAPLELEDVVKKAALTFGDWAPTLGRVLLGLVLAWFGYHELVQPGVWTGYVPILSPRSNLSVALVLIHGWVLFVLAAALIFGFALRVSAGIAAVLLFEIVVSLIASGGLSDLVLRDVGVLGLALILVGSTRQRLVLGH